MRVAALRVIDEVIGRNALDHAKLVYRFSRSSRLRLVREPLAFGYDAREMLHEIIKVQWWVRPDAARGSLWNVVASATEQVRQ